MSILLRGIDKKVVPQDIEEFFEDFGCSSDGAGTDSEGFCDLAVGEVDEALTESHGLSGEEREKSCGGGV